MFMIPYCSATYGTVSYGIISYCIIPYGTVQYHYGGIRYVCSTIISYHSATVDYHMYSYVHSATVSYYIRTVSCADGPLASAEREGNMYSRGEHRLEGERSCDRR